jgi:hypothetical protein
MVGGKEYFWEVWREDYCGHGKMEECSPGKCSGKDLCEHSNRVRSSSKECGGSLCGMVGRRRTTEGVQREG